MSCLCRNVGTESLLIGLFGLSACMRVKELPAEEVPDDLLHESPVCSPPSELDVSVMEVPSKKV